MILFCCTSELRFLNIIIGAIKVNYYYLENALLTVNVILINNCLTIQVVSTVAMISVVVFMVMNTYFC